MEDFFGSDSFFLHLLELRRTNREEMALALKEKVEKVCRRIVHDPNLGFGIRTNEDMWDYTSASIVWVLEHIDSFLDNPRNHPDSEAEDRYSAFERQSWLRFQVLRAMKDERRRLFYSNSITVVNINAPVPAHDKDEKTGEITLVSPNPEPGSELEYASVISERLRAIMDTPCQIDTILCVLYAILATTADRKCTYDDCETRLKGKTRQDISQMILDAFCMQGLSSSVDAAVYDDLLSMLHKRLSREDPNITVEGITADKIRKSKNRLFGLIDKKKGD